MIKKIAHFADYHIHNDKWYERYKVGNEWIYSKLKEEKPDRIVIAGDLFENFIIISNEAKILASEFLFNLTEIAPVIIVEGNHDLRKKSLNRTTSIKTVVDIMNNQKITHYNKSGFYDDDNVVWVNHSHLEKDINPWTDIQHIRDKNKVYIDLWHDPVNGCEMSNGMVFKSKNLRNITDFKGDFGLFGDIHKFQYLNKSKTHAYCSSTFQQDMGEDVEKHGFLLWNIEDKTSEFVIVPDEWKLITFITNEDYDYDNISFNHPLATKKCDFRVVWRDYSSNINNENENKINKYFLDKWGSKPRYEKERIYSNISSSQKLTESININDKVIQQEIFKEYLKSNKYDDSFIEEILEIDNIIEDRLEITNTINNVEWSINKLWVDNFKSYKYFELDWTDIKGIIQLNGENQQGKTTILDAITYITHGTTLATNKLGGGKKEKNGDNRYINNKRKEDYCTGGMVIDINGDKFTLLRRTDRSWKKDGSISNVSTNIEYYSGIEVTEENKLVGEQKIDTQNKINSIIGDFDDFIRLTLTNSENLNYLISLDRATFIDSVIKDAGFDIFEKKLNEFKEYKKTLIKERIDINLNDAEEEVSGLKDLLKTHKSEHDEIKKEISDIDISLKGINTLRDIEMKKLYKIDGEIANIDVDSANRKIEEYKQTIDTNLSTQKNNSGKMKGLKTEYDKVVYDSFLKQIKIIDDDILNLKLKISQEENKIEKEKSNILRVDDKVKQLKQKEIDSQKSKLVIINNDIEKIDNELKDAIENKKRDYLDQKKTQEFEVKTLTTELANIKEKGLDKKSQIKELEESDECPTCGASPEHQRNIVTKVEKLKSELSELLKIGIETQNKLKDSKELVLLLQKSIDDVDSDIELLELKETIKEKLELKRIEIEQVNIICEEIRNNNFINVPELENNINQGLKIKTNSNQLIIDIGVNIKNINQLIKDKVQEKSDMQDKVYLIERDREEVKIYETLSQENKELSLKIENIKLTIENAKIKIDKYYDQLKYIEENKTIEEKIEEYDQQLSEKEEEKTNLNENLAEVMKEAIVCKDTIKDIQNNIKKYLEQVKRDELLKEYQKCVHRDGIPTFLLQKSKDLINIELGDMLTNVDFDVFFDEHLNLKMYMKNSPWAIQNLLESSGKERTFGAVALKMALRTVNNKSRPNIFLMDEVMLKLKNKSVTEFNDMLESMKKKIDKIIIIEHVHTVPFDVLIEVEKNKEGVSSLNIS